MDDPDSNSAILMYYKYKAAAFAGVRSFSGMGTGGNRICSVVACTGDTIDTCGKRFPDHKSNATAVFEELIIVAEVPTPKLEELGAADSIFYPVSLDVSINPLKPSSYTYEVEELVNKTSQYTFKLNNATSELYSFAVWGRVFAGDGEEATPPLNPHNASSIKTLTFWVIMLYILAIVQVR